VQQRASKVEKSVPRRTTRRSTRGISTTNDDTHTTNSVTPKLATEVRDEMKEGLGEEYPNEDDNEEDDQGKEEGTVVKHVLDGVEFDTYADFVAAKRKRNEEKLKSLGFMDESSKFMAAVAAPKRPKPSLASQRGIKKMKTTTEPGPIRKSSRLSRSKTDLISLDYYVNDWNRDNSTIVRQGEGQEGDVEEAEEKETFFKGRVNDGSDLSLRDAIELNDAKWVRENSVAQAESLLHGFKAQRSSSAVLLESHISGKKKTSSPTSVMSMKGDTTSETKLLSMVNDLTIDNEEWVAKVTPDRIYSVATHPNVSKLICCAGDKQGYVGLWDVDAQTAEENNTNHGVHLFRPHSRPICCMEWLNNDNMVTASYDGSVRRLNVEKGVFEEIFATYDESDTTYLGDLGFGLDQGYNYWTQYVTPDHRSKGMSNPCLFISTSFGEVFHADLRSTRKEMITFHETVSDKKINTVR
jgi:hypothetical protein